MSDRRRKSDQQELLAAAQAGDEEAFRQLIEPYRHALDVHCYRMLGSTHDAEDLVQETLLRAWRALGRFEPRAQLQTWLYRIATNAAWTSSRGAPAGRSRSIRSRTSPRTRAGRPTTRRRATRFGRGWSWRCCARSRSCLLANAHVLIFRDVLGWSAPEVADLLESSVASVNSALQRARAATQRPLPATAESEAEPVERELLERYVAAFADDDVDGLVALLREDAVLRMPPQPSLIGAVQIARFFRDTAGGGELSRIRLTPTRANGRPAVAIHRRDDAGEARPARDLGAGD